MMKNKACTVYAESACKSEAYKGMIACEPQLHQETGDFYVLVMSSGRLIRVDTDYIKIVEIVSK